MLTNNFSQEFWSQRPGLLPYTSSLKVELKTRHGSAAFPGTQSCPFNQYATILLFKTLRWSRLQDRGSVWQYLRPQSWNEGNCVVPIWRKPVTRCPNSSGPASDRMQTSTSHCSGYSEYTRTTYIFCDNLVIYAAGLCQLNYRAWNMYGVPLDLTIQLPFIISDHWTAGGRL